MKDPGSYSNPINPSLQRFRTTRMVLNSGIGQRGGGTMPVPTVGTFLTRGKAARQATMLTAITPDALVPQGHPIRRIKPMVHRALEVWPESHWPGFALLQVDVLQSYTA